jgi:hypothetical protein
VRRSADARLASVSVVLSSWTAAALIVASIAPPSD